MTTRSDGRYLIPGLQPGSYRISASGLGYGTQTRTDITLTLGQTANFDFTLGAQAVALDELTVVSERNAVISQGRTGASAVVSDSTPAAHQQLPAICRTSPGWCRNL